MRRVFLTLFITTLFVLPALVSAQTSTAPQGLVPCDGPECQTCDVIKLGQNLINFFVGIASFIGVVIFSWAGFLMITASGDTGKISKAKGMFTSVLFGIVIVLVGWLVVDTVMKYAFIDSPLDTEAQKKWKFGPWNEIKCVALPVNQVATQGPPGTIAPSPGGGGGRGPRGRTTCPGINPYCSPTALEKAGFDGPGQANVMSCIAMTESEGFPNGPCSETGACGLFQITRGNWANPKLHQPPCSTDRSGINNAMCNTQTALLLFKANHKKPYSDWTGVYGPGHPQAGQPFNPAARTCVETFGQPSDKWW